MDFFSSFEIARAVVVYAFAIVTMVIVYGCWLSKEDKGFAAFIGGTFGAVFGVLAALGLILYVIGPSLAEIGIILAFMCIFCIMSLVSLLRKNEDLSLAFANIVTFLFFLPIIFEWFMLPTVPVETLGGKVFWQLIQIALSVILGYFLDRTIKKEK